MSTEVVFADYGVTLLKRGDRLFVRYDIGGIAVRFVEREVTEAQAQRLRQDEAEAYRVLLEFDPHAAKNI